MNEGDIVPALREPPRTAEIKKQWYWLWAVLVNSIVYNLMRGSLLTRLPSSLSPALPPEGPACYQCVTTGVTVHWGKSNQLTFQGLGNTGSELMLVLGDPKKHCALQLKAGLTDVR